MSSRYGNASELARSAALSPRKLREAFLEHAHLTPEEALTRAKVRRLIDATASTACAPSDIASAAALPASGLEALLTASTGLTVMELRMLSSKREFSMRLPPDFRSEFALRIAGRDGESPAEKVVGTKITKAAFIDGERVVVELDLKRSGRAHCSVLSGSPMAAHRVARRILGLDIDPSGFETRLAKSPRLARLVAGRRGLRIPQTASVFEAIAWSIIGQQVNLAFAFKLRRVMIELAGEKFDGLVAHPDAAAVARLDYSDLTTRQYSRSKAQYLIDTARRIADGQLQPESWPRRSATAAAAELRAVRGIGPWSANYVLMRGCAFADCVPLGDTGLSSSLQEFFKLAERPDARATAELMGRFAPHRSLATFHFWMRKGDPA